MRRRTLGFAVLGLLAAFPLSAQSMETLAGSRVRGDIARLTADVTFGMADFTLRAGAAELYRFAVTFDADRFRAVHTFDEADRHLEVGVLPLEGQDDLEVEDQRVDLTLSTAVRTTLHLGFGAGQSDLDLGGLDLATAVIETGASRTTLDFSEPAGGRCEQLEIHLGAAEFTARRLGNSGCANLEVAGAAGAVTLDFTGTWETGNMQAEVTLGFGGLNLRLPRTVGVSLGLSRFLASFDRSGLERRGDRWVSPGFDDASAILELDVRAVVGDVAIEWVGN